MAINRVGKARLNGSQRVVRKVFFSVLLLSYVLREAGDMVILCIQVTRRGRCQDGVM